ncbi:hypothetical protein [Streptomyces sp. NPDC020141]|uniref:hypothetical protein n=1 Tax=Streptomyces sp. NPDC020141 TaxID=3365065 RepID=UPI00379BA536
MPTGTAEALLSTPDVTGATDQTIPISRDVLGILALVDITQTARRVLDFLLAIHDDETGVGHISQDELSIALGSSKPRINRAIRDLAECGLAWRVKRAQYQIHPALTGGKVCSPVLAIPEIKVPSADTLNTVRRARYSAQLANLANTA